MEYLFINTRKTNEFTELMKASVMRRFEKIEKFLKQDEPIKISLETYNVGVKIKAQVITQYNQHIIAEHEAHNFYDGIVRLREIILEKIKRNKANQARDIFINEEEVDEGPRIKKIKEFTLECINPEMAVNEMEKLGHSWYVFKNKDQDDKTCIIYQRLDGDFSMIVLEN